MHCEELIWSAHEPANIMDYKIQCVQRGTDDKGYHKIFPYGVLAVPPLWPLPTQNATSKIPGPFSFKALCSSSCLGVHIISSGLSWMLRWYDRAGVSRTQINFVSVAMIGREPIIDVICFDRLVISLSSTRRRIWAIPKAVEAWCVFEGGSRGTWRFYPSNHQK
jgi:hypothetical protein